MPETTEPATPTPSRTKGKPSARALGLLVVLALVVYGLDQGTKALIVANLDQYERVQVLGEFLQLYFVKNSGAAFSLGTGYTWVLSLVAVGAIAFIIGFAPRIRSLGWAAMFGLVLGGALGNATDRLFREPSFGMGHVVDFIQLWIFPAIFNIADMSIVFAMVIFVLLTLRGVRLDGKRDSTPVAPIGDDATPIDGAAARPADSER